MNNNNIDNYKPIYQQLETLPRISFSDSEKELIAERTLEICRIRREKIGNIESDSFLAGVVWLLTELLPPEQQIDKLWEMMENSSGIKL